MTTSRHERLTHYAAAASVVSLGSIATADIIHRAVGHSFTSPNTQFRINALTGNTVNQSGNPGSFDSGSFAFNFLASPYSSWAGWNAYAARGLKGDGRGGVFAFNLAFLDGGDVISGVMSLFGDNRVASQSSYTSTYFSTTVFAPHELELNAPTYIGFGVGDGSGGTLYGWAQIMFTNDDPTSFSLFTLHIIDYAYDDTGAAITAGDTGATAIPGAGGLVALACGAAGLRRRRRNRATTPETTETA